LSTTVFLRKLDSARSTVDRQHGHTMLYDGSRGVVTFSAALPITIADAETKYLYLRAMDYGRRAVKLPPAEREWNCFADQLIRAAERRVGANEY
jgi:hypothetical protein